MDKKQFFDLYWIEFPIMEADLTDLFGDPREPNFERDFLVNLDFSKFSKQFEHVKNFKSGVYGHYILQEVLNEVFEDICSKNLERELKTFEGCWNVRLKTSGSGLSVHSWGLALDFNAKTNAYGSRKTDLSNPLIGCFARHGFEWGGLWKDPMHFQLPWTRNWNSKTDLLKPRIGEE